MVFNPFEGLTKEQIQTFTESLTGRSSWANYTLEERDSRAKNISVGKKLQWSSYTAEERDRQLSRTVNSPRNQALKGKYWLISSPEDKRARLNNSIHSPEGKEKQVEATRSFWKGLSPEEIESRVRRSILSEEGISNRGKAHSKYLRSLSREELDLWMRQRCLSDEAILKCARSNSDGLSTPEWFLGMFVKEYFLGKWGYNGNSELGVVVGGRIPDYVNINGRRSVIEILGGIGYHHFLDEEEEIIAHYKKYGYDCLVLFEWDCYDWGDGLKEKVLSIS